MILVNRCVFGSHTAAADSWIRLTYIFGVYIICFPLLLHHVKLNSVAIKGILLLFSGRQIKIQAWLVEIIDL